MREGDVGRTCSASSSRRASSSAAPSQKALGRIGALYGLEQTLREHSPDTRTAMRQHKSQPLLDALHAWLVRQHPFRPKADATARAIDDTLGRSRALCVLPAMSACQSNNPVGNAIRPLALGRKNWLLGSPRACSRAAVLMTLIESAKLRNADPWPI